MWFDRSENESAYLKWLSQNPDGFVLNHPKGSSHTGNIAHRASCPTIWRAVRNTSPGRLTDSYIKFCALDFHALAQALEERTPDARFRPCRECRPESAESYRPTKNWWVSHGKSFKRELGDGYIWCPQVRAGDHQRTSWLNVAKVQPGDRIISYAQQRIRAIGVAQSAAYDAPPPEGHNSWSGLGWRVDVAWRQLEDPISPKEHIDAMRPHLPMKHSPLDATGKGLLVYLVSISESLANLVLELLGERNVELQEDLDRAQIDATAINETERQALYSARIGQGIFKSRVGLIEKSCRLTGADDPRYLIASHIKPWRVSSNSERLDGHNGLLLAPHVDRLFDRGDISFGDDGELLVRDALTAGIMKAWKLPRKGHFGPFSDEQLAYLKYHRQHLFFR